MNERMEKSGVGKERSITDTNDPNVIRVGFHDDMSAEKVRAYFSLYKIAHLIFPNNIPSPAGYGTDESGVPYVDVSRVERDPAHILAQVEGGANIPHPSEEHSDHVVKHYEKMYSDRAPERDEFLQKMESAGFLNTGNHRFNFSHTEGKLIYMDFGQPWQGEANGLKLGFDPDKLAAAIAAIPDPARQNEARSLFSDLMQIVPKAASPSA